MPILFRYLISQQLSTFLLCTCAFIAILLTARLEEIARFASLGASASLLFKFTLNQIPYVLPIAIPISALIASFILFQRLSQSNELTALRSSGFSIKEIMGPLLFVALLLSIGNFYIVSEMATESHLTTNVLKQDLRAVNPLLLLHNKHLMRMKGIYFEALGGMHFKDGAADVVLAMPNKKNGKIDLVLAKNMVTIDNAIFAKGLTVITSTPDDTSLLIENIDEAKTNVPDFAELVKVKHASINPDLLRMPLLIQKIMSSEDRREQIRGYTEIIRRFSISFATFTFALMGMAFGMGIGRARSSKALFFAIGLSTLFLAAYFTANNLDYRLKASIGLYLVPHALILLFSTLYIHRIVRGIE